MKYFHLSTRHMLLLTVFVSFAVSVYFVGCSKGVSGPVIFGGYVFDITNHSIIKDFAMEVETADGKDAASIDSDTGKFDFSTPVGADYVVKVVKSSYRVFISANQGSLLSTHDDEINESGQKFMYNVALVPENVMSPKIIVKVIDSGNGNNITSGFYRVYAKAIAGGFKDGAYQDGEQNTGTRWWVPDARVLAGAITDGEFTIDENALLPGYEYSVAIIGATGYRDQVVPYAAATLPIGTTDINTVQKITIKLVPQSQPDAPKLLAQSHVGPDGAKAIPIGASRTITFTFDRDILLNKNGLKGPTKGSNSLLGLVAIANDDGDSTTTTSTMTVESPAADAYSSNVVVAVSGNKLTIILAADSTLLNGTIDTDDDLEYTLTATLLAGIQIKDAASTYADGSDGWKAFTVANFPTLQTNVAIRANYP